MGKIINSKFSSMKTLIYIKFCHKNVFQNKIYRVSFGTLWFAESYASKTCYKHKSYQFPLITLRVLHIQYNIIYTDILTACYIKKRQRKNYWTW